MESFSQQPLLPSPEHHAYHQVEELSLSGQKLFSILTRKEQFPDRVVSRINNELNKIADGFLFKIKSTVSGIFQINHDLEWDKQIYEHRQGTILDTENWNNVIEKKYEKAIRLFPEILREKQGKHVPIQSIPGPLKNPYYDLVKVSLIPLIVNISIELGLFTDDLRGGLLLPWFLPEDIDYEDQKGTVLKDLFVFDTDKEVINDCAFAVLDRLKQSNHIKKEDIQNLDLGCMMKDKEYSERGFQLLVDLDPETMLAKPACSDDNRFHIHIADSLNEFKFKFSLGMQHFPEKFGFAFMVTKYRDHHGKSQQLNTPFCNVSRSFLNEGDSAQKVVVDCITQYCRKENSVPFPKLLMRAVNDNNIHFDLLYILLRNDPLHSLKSVKKELLVLET